MSKLKKIYKFIQNNLLHLVSLLLIIPLGFYSKAYQGVAQNWVGNSLGGVFYEIFWILIFALVFPKTRIFTIAVSVFLITSLLEILQLWHPPFLRFLRSFYVGRSLLGNCFVWSDFFYYLIGSTIGFFWVKTIKKAPEIGA